MAGVDRSALTKWIIDRAQALGAAAAGVAAVAPMNPAPLQTWLAAGYGAEMAFLQRHVPLRADVRTVLPEANSVICLAIPYPASVQAGSIAAYARGADYHDVVRGVLETLWAEILERNPSAQARLFVDSGPLPERELARRAGIGWPGAHSCLIATGIGTRFVLGEILTTLALTSSDPAYGSCGSCRRCLDACPTGAIVSPGVVDARRCLSYLTIEHRGAIPRELRPLMGTRLFGCDTCQDACPHNAGVEGMPSLFPPHPHLLAPDAQELLGMTPAAFKQRFRGTSLLRAKWRGVLRNACVVLGNQGNLSAIPALTNALELEPLIRGHAAWALGRLGAQAPLLARLPREDDAWVRAEIVLALAETGHVCTCPAG